MMEKKVKVIRVDFSLRREVFFVVVGAIVGALVMIIPKTILEVGMGLPYYLTWVAFGHIVGIYSPTSVIVGITLHILTAISIGIILGIFLYKTGILNISKISNGLIFGLLAGSALFTIFFIPLQQFILAPEIAHTMSNMMFMSQQEAARHLSSNFLNILVGSAIMHLVFGITLGIISSFLSIKFGSRYRCPLHDISFSRIDSFQKHEELVHGKTPIQQKRILILGGGFAGIQVLRQLQKAFQDDVSVDITLVSRDNFFLFTPMLPEVSSGMIETRHIVTPIRTFCNRAKFYEANIESVDLENKQVLITHAVGNETDPIAWRSHVLKYDYLVLALGGETNFFGMTQVAKYAFTMKSIDDAMILRNHVINMLEQADVENEDKELKKSLITFVVVGGGFSGVETVGELNDFVRESIKHYYYNIEVKEAKIILVNSGSKILPEVTEDLAEFALQELRRDGVEVILNTRLVGAERDRVNLSNGVTILCNTIVWTGGISPDHLVRKLECDHDKAGRIIANNHLEILGFKDAFAIGDCACIKDPRTGNPYPPTAQHALRQARVVANNLISLINGRSGAGVEKVFDYKTKGMMALIGKRNGVGILFGHKVHGFTAWWLWRSYYLGNLPTVEKKLRVIVDWFIDLFFKRDVTRLKTLTVKRSIEDRAIQTKQTEA
jgi:NADH:ubiquinone reductase (H+-translocating)